MAATTMTVATDWTTFARRRIPLDAVELYSTRRRRRSSSSILWPVILFVIIPISVTSTITTTVSSATTQDATSAFREFQFSVEPNNTVAVRDLPAMLDCSAAGSPTPSIEWKRDGVFLQLAGDPRRSILPNGSLYFSSVHHTRSERPDEGVYQCVANINDQGIIVSRTAKLQVASLPRFDEQPRDLTIFPGQTARFACSIQGIPPAIVSWIKDDHQLQVDPIRMTVLPSGALEIDLVQLGDQGAYRCNASNMDKYRVSQQGVLTVNLDTSLANRISAPQFVAIPPSNVIAIEGSDLTLDCAANGNPRPHITWLKDGATIDLADLDSRFHKEGTGNLKIFNVHETDHGIYMCRAENHEDSVDASASVEIQVPPRFVHRPSNRVAYEKEDVELECEIYGRPEPTMQWVKSGDLIVESEYFQIVNGRNLRILGLVSSDEGVYQCLGGNPAGNVQAGAKLVILKSGDSVTVPLIPNPSITTPLIHLDPLTTTTIATMTITPSTNEMDASLAGQSSNADTPSPPLGLTAVIVSTRFVTLTWQPPLKPAGTVQAYSVYFRPGASLRERVVNTTRLRLEEANVRGLRPSTTYFFRVLAYNEHGPGESSEELEVVTQSEVHVPGPPLNLIALAMSPTTIRVQWEPPKQYNGPVQRYKVFYMEVGTSEEHEVEVTSSPAALKGLEKFTEYSIWVVAHNQNGPGLSTDEIVIRTYSDVPGEIPQNVTLEAASSMSIIVRWEPPTKENANGIITGYKVRYKQKGSRRGDTVTTDGNRRLYALTGLERGAEYSVRMSALTVNGTGPYTEWMSVETYQNDLDESRVPDPPTNLKARPNSNSIIVSWGPPHNPNIMVRGYIIGWGIGVPYHYTKTLDSKQRYIQIDNLEPLSEYVISLRAFNQIGDGQPIYDTVKTRLHATPEPLSPMLPPVGLKAIVLSSTTVVLYWTDSTLPKSQVITDSRNYIGRYTTYFTTNPRYKYFNASDLNFMIDDLKPNTQYEFAVKVVKNRRESTWSLSVLNTTHEAAPSSPPRDLTVFPNEKNPSSIILNWQPPKQPNGLITGYVIFYTADNTKMERDWVVEGIVGEKMTAVIRGFTPNTTYYFKIQARNNKGYGPMSQTVTFRTGTAGFGLFGVDMSLDDSAFYGRDGNGSGNDGIFVIIAGTVLVAVLIFVVVVTFFMCRRRNYYGRSERKKKGYLGKVTGKGKGDINPPDLWIHHDRMELKDMDKGRNSETSTMTVTPIPRNSTDLDSSDKLCDSLEKRVPAYIVSGGCVDSNGINNKSDTASISRRLSRPKPISLTIDLQQSQTTPSEPAPMPNGNLNQHGGGVGDSMQSGSRPIYPRTQYNIPRAHFTAETTPGGPGGNSPDLPSPGIYNQQVPMPYDQVTSVPVITGATSSTVGTGQMPSSYNTTAGSQQNPNNTDSSSGTLGKRPAGHPLKSFSVPAPPPQSAPATPQPKHIVRPQPAASPYKKPIIGGVGSTTSPASSQPVKSHVSPMTIITPRTTSDIGFMKGGNKDERLAPSYSNEELTAEMANLEGLMKDLNAITASEFEC